MLSKTIIAMLLALLIPFTAYAQDVNSELIEAAKNGQTEKVQASLDAGADVNGKDRDGMTALMWAASGGHTDIVKALLDAGADPSLKDKGDSTASFWAMGRNEIVSLLKKPAAEESEKVSISAKSTRIPAAEPVGEDWPNFLGPHFNATSRETGLLKSWPPGGPPVLWSRQLGASYSAPVTSRGHLVLFHRLGMEEVVECVDARTGVRIWKQSYPSTYVDQFGYNNGPRSSPTIDGSRVYTFGAEGKLTSLDFETGRILWQRWINQEYGVQQNFFGVGTAAIVEGDLILLNAGGPDGAGVIAFDKNTGDTVWKTSNEGASYSTPVVRTINRQRLAIVFARGGLLAVEVQSGQERYRYPFSSRNYYSVNAASPVVVEDYVFLSATYNTGAVLLKLKSGGLKKIWKDRLAMQNHWATSIYHGGYLYGMDGRHERSSNFRCIEFMTGKVRWTADRGLGRAAFIMADGHLIALGERGHLALIEVNPDSYGETARAQVLRYPCWTPPVLSHGLLYVRNETRLICLDLRVK